MYSVFICLFLSCFIESEVYYMAKITISSTRVYYNELHNEDASMIKHDICVYQSMRKKAYKELYDNYTYGNQLTVNPKYLKSIYSTNDYFPLSAIAESKSLLKSQKTCHQKTIKNDRNRVKKIEKKIHKEETELLKYERTLKSLIQYSRTKALCVRQCPNMYWDKLNPDLCIYKGQPMNLYLFEVQYLKPMIKCIKSRIKQLIFRKQRYIEKIERMEYRMKMIHFKRSNYIKITGRAQGKYCNNLFKYNHQTNEMTYIDTYKRKITFSLDFPYRKEELIRVLNMKHETPGKAVCYTLRDYGDYFIIFATIELNVQYENYQFEIRGGVVGIDINTNHISLAEIDHHGNLIRSKEYSYSFENKRRNQRRWIIEQTVKEVLAYCVKVNKPLIIEQLDFEKKKQDFKMYQKDKRYHQMLSEFSYRQIIEKLYARAYKDGIGIEEVNPSYTSQIGKVKYASINGLSVHRCAAYVIARRGMGYKERLPLNTYGNIDVSLEERWKQYLSRK